MNRYQRVSLTLQNHTVLIAVVIVAALGLALFAVALGGSDTSPERTSEEACVGYKIDGRPDFTRTKGGDAVWHSVMSACADKGVYIEK